MNRAFRVGLTTIIMLSVSACAEVAFVGAGAKRVTTTTDQSPSGQNQGQQARPGGGGGVYKVGRPYQINGVWYTPQEDPNYDETGIASWYGEEFHGRPTANGETFDMNELTAAHRTLPMPVFVRVTNLENGRSLILRVNDRGPFARNRIIDVSRRAAQLLGFERQGVAQVRVQFVGPASGDPTVAQPVAPPAPDNDAPPVVAAPRGGVTSAVLSPPPGATAAPASPPPPTAAAPTLPASQPGLTPVATAPANSIEADRARLNSQEVRVLPVRQTNIFIQAGAFSQFENANQMVAKLSPYGRANINRAMVNGADFYRVRLGPLSDVQQADQLLASLQQSGFPEARIVIE